MTMCASTAYAQVIHYDAVGYVTYPEEKPNWVIAQLMITPKTGWKWNAEYPHSFTVERSLKLLDRHFAKKEKAVTVSFLFHRPKKITMVTIVGKFSVCSSTTCVVLRDQRFQYKILSTKSTKKN